MAAGIETNELNLEACVVKDATMNLKKTIKGSEDFTQLPAKSEAMRRGELKDVLNVVA